MLVNTTSLYEELKVKGCLIFENYHPNYNLIIHLIVNLYMWSQYKSPLWKLLLYSWFLFLNKLITYYSKYVAMRLININLFNNNHSSWILKVSLKHAFR